VLVEGHAAVDLCLEWRAAMALQPLSKYNFYPCAGDGRDAFIKHVSDHQTDFNYVSKAPQMPGTRQPGMASNTVGLGFDIDYKDKPYGVSGYTGLTPGYKGEPTQRDAFPNLGSDVPELDKINTKSTASMRASFAQAKQQQNARMEALAYRIPGYAGHCPGHHQTCGFTHGAICVGEAGNTMLAAIGMDAPGLNAGEQLIKSTNLQPGAVTPAGLPRTKTGYTGHVFGKHYSSNFGKNYPSMAEELLATRGKPAAGGIGDPNTPFNADTDKLLTYPAGHIERPPKLQVACTGYAGFRPRTTPNYWKQ